MVDEFLNDMKVVELKDGACELRVARCTANAISGRVHRLIHRRLPTIDWNICTVSLCGVLLPVDGSIELPAPPSSPPIGTLTDADLDNPNFSSISSMTHSWFTTQPVSALQSNTMPRN